MSTELAGHLKGFFQTYLRDQRGLRPNTIRSYRDTFKLLLLYLGSRHPNRRHLSVGDLDPKTILAFLKNLEDPNGRSNSALTRNLRLHAIHAFFRYLSIYTPKLERHAKIILAIPSKRAVRKEAEHLSRRELETLFAQPTTTTSDGIRDLAILVFLYNTAARAQEVADIKISSFDPPNRTVKIFGKGGKERVNPLWPVTVKLLEFYQGKHRRLPKEPASDRFFVNQRGLGFTRFGIRSIVKKYLSLAAKSCPSIQAKRLSTHNMRHTTASHLLESRAGLNAIKDLCGHVSIKSTGIYLHTHLDHKRRILDRFGPPTYLADILEPKPDDPPEKILDWLNDL